EATEIFFVEHARQAYAPTTSLRAVDLYDQVLLPVMRGRISDMTSVVERFASRSWGVADRRLVSVERLLELLLADPRVVEGLGEELPDDELGDGADPRSEERRVGKESRSRWLPHS